jgi:hypothetical protein
MACEKDLTYAIALLGAAHTITLIGWLFQSPRTTQ